MATGTKGSSDGQQPEALRSLEAAAEAGSKKPDGQGLQARADTAPEPDPLAKEHAEATEILKNAAERDTGGQA